MCLCGVMGRCVGGGANTWRKWPYRAELVFPSPQVWHLWIQPTTVWKCICTNNADFLLVIIPTQHKNYLQSTYIALAIVRSIDMIYSMQEDACGFIKTLQCFIYSSCVSRYWFLHESWILSRYLGLIKRFPTFRDKFEYILRACDDLRN